MTTIENTARLARYAPTSQEVIVDIPLPLLGISVPHLVRPLDAQYIAELAQTDETVWEPIEVRAWPQEWRKPTDAVVYHVVSGNHRTSAAQSKNLATLRARVIEAASQLEYLLAAIRTNARHGRNFTNDERRTLAEQLKAEGLSSNDIANHFSVNKSTVNNWLSGRDSNASKKKAAMEQAKETLANLDTQELSDEWKYVPTITADARQLAKVGQMINDFLAGSPNQEDKAHVVAWVRTLSKEARQSIAQDMCETIQWLTNVAVLLKDGESHGSH